MGFSLKICDSEFFNPNISWHVSQPNFSPCFRDTLLVWLPATLFLVALIIEHIRLSKHEAKIITWNWFNTTRIVVTTSLLILKICEFVSYLVLIYNDQQSDKTTNIVISSVTAPLIVASCYCLLDYIYYRHRKSGVHTSGPIWFYLLSSVLCDSIEYYAIIAQARPALTNDTEHLVKLIHFPLLLVLFLLECRGDTPNLPPQDLGGSQTRSPENDASFFSSISFWWFNKFLWIGYKTQLRVDSLWATIERDKASKIVPVLRNAWLTSRRPSESAPKYVLSNGLRQHFNSIIPCLFKLYWPKLLKAAILKLMHDSLQFITPLLLKQLLDFLTYNQPFWHGIIYASLFLIVPTMQSMCLATYFYTMQVMGQQVKSMIAGSVYRKALSLSGSSRSKSTSGEIVNLMAVDSVRFQDLLMYVNILWSAPYQIIVSIILIYREIGWPVFAGVAIIILFIPIQMFLAMVVRNSSARVMKTKDERIKQLSEIFSGIKVLKLYAWENSFISNLFCLRNLELRLLNKIMTLEAFHNFMWQTSPFIVALVTFTVYAMASPSNVLTPSKAFVSISLINILRSPLTMLPNLISSLVLTLVSAKRITRFLNNNELVRYVTRNEESEAISIEGGTVAWSNEDHEGKPVGVKDAILKDIDLHVKRGSFVAIVGHVASGKSSLLSSILGEMHRIAGRFNIAKSCSIAYVPQQAWIQNLTVKDNILFGSECDEHKYRRILSVCSLTTDLKTLPGGDQAEIGEKGINLSGGQKQRVSLARACYSDSDIYLLDDPLSALDSHVARHVFEHVLSSTTGLLRSKTRVLATNNLFVLPFTDQVLVLSHGKVVESGTYADLMKISGGHLVDFMNRYSGPSSEKTVEDETKSLETTVSKLDATEAPESAKALMSRKEEGKLTELEKEETGSVGFSIYFNYFRAASWAWFAAVIVAGVLNSILNVVSNVWLSEWSSDPPTNNPELRDMRLRVYASIAGVLSLSILFGAISLSRGAIRASRIMHTNLLEKIMHSPMSFFDTTPLGRIANRCAKDIDVIDSTLPQTLRSWLLCMLQIASTIFVTCYSFPKFLFIVLILGLVFYVVQKIFIATTRQLKRLESNTRSPIYSHFNETLSGVATIRAYDCTSRFISYSERMIDRNQSCSYPNVIANRWLSVRLEFFGNFVTAMSALFSVYHRDTTPAGIAGLTISFAMNLTQTLSWFVRMTSDLETNIVSVERIVEYTQNQQEDQWIKENRPFSAWPDKGEIVLKDYSTRYRSDTDLVLKDINISIASKEKIGIVGRTGSGKSSLSLALFRILEPITGTILIDGCDITSFGLHDIRSRLTIIPQDPVLFSGTLRFNLDPLALYSDEEIWRALDLAHLKQYIKTSRNGLEYTVLEYGENFSVGQRQLICLARAILRKSKILILDEATASVDIETDSIVQKTIREIFAECTIITIAHRLHTILDSDRILVLDDGVVKELDTPAKLTSDQNSMLASLMKDAFIRHK